MIIRMLSVVIVGFMCRRVVTPGTAFICARMVYRRNVAIKADWMYRALNLSVALGAIAAPFLSPSLWVSLTGAMLLVAVAVAADLTRSVRLVEGAPPGLRDAVLSAGALRRRRIG